jgi:hypothetical protein
MLTNYPTIGTTLLNNYNTQTTTASILSNYATLGTTLLTNYNTQTTTTSILSSYQTIANMSSYVTSGSLSAYAQITSPSFTGAPKINTYDVALKPWVCFKYTGGVVNELWRCHDIEC